MFNKLFVLSCILGLSGICIETNGQDAKWWPQFRGPNALGVAQTGEYPAKFDDKNLIWKASIHSGVSSPCIWEEHIFLTAMDKKRNVLETVCIDRKSGKILWQKDRPTKEIEKVHDVSSPATATPATDGKSVFVYFESFGLIAYDFEGNEKWNQPLPMRESRFGHGTSPIVYNGKVILARDTPGGSRFSKSALAAFSAETGKQIWKSSSSRFQVRYSTPVVWVDDETTQVLILGGRRLSAFDLETGKSIWYVSNLPPQMCSTPLIDDDQVYVTATGVYGEPESLVDFPEFSAVLEKHDSNSDGTLNETEIPDDFLIIDRRASNGAGNNTLKQFFARIDRNRDQSIDEKEWTRFVSGFEGAVTRIPPGVFSIKLGGERNVTKENVVWKNPRGVAEVPSLLMYADKLFLVRNSGIVHCRNKETGEDIYRGRLGAPGGYYASPVAADGKVYFASDRGVVTTIDAQSEKLSVLAQSDLKEPVFGTPALVDGIVYIRTLSHLLAFGKRQKDSKQ